MEISQFSNWIPNIIIGIFQLVIGITHYLDNRQKGKDDRKEKSDAVDQNLIDNLTKTVALYEGRIKSLEEQQKVDKEQQKQNMERINILTGKNATLLEILQGRDEQTIKFQTDGLQAMSKFPALERTILETHEFVANLCKLMEEHLKNIENAVTNKEVEKV